MHGIITIVIVIFVISIISFFFKNFFRMFNKHTPMGSVMNNITKPDTPERCIVRTAKRYGNKITVIDVIRECNMDADTAQEILNDFAKKGYADMRVTENGAVVYYFYDSETA